MKRLFTSIFLLALAFTTVSPAFAQEAAPAAESNSDVSTDAGVCAPYLTKDSVTLSVAPTVTETIPGSTVTLVGSIKNSNSFPIVSGEVWARVYRVAAGEPIAVVDQFQAANNLTLKAASEVPLTFSWEAPNNLPVGTYRVVLSLVSQKNFTIKSFADAWTAGQSGVFSVVGESEEKTVMFDSASIKINGVSTDALKRQVLVSGEDVTVSIAVNNESNQTKRVPLQWNQYALNNLDASHIRNTETEVLTLAPGETKELTYTVTPQAEGLTELVIVTQDGATKHMIPLSFVQEGLPAAVVTFAALQNPLVKSGEEGALFACVQNADPSFTGAYTISLALTDSAGTVIHEAELPFTDTANIVKTTFTPDKDVSASKLTTILKLNGATLSETVTLYDCQTVAGIACEAAAPVSFLAQYGMYILLAVVMVLLIIVVVLQLVKRRRAMVPPLLCAGVFLGLSLFAPGHVTFAQSCTLGNEVQITDVDGTNAGIPDMRTAPDCQATNYIAPAYGGTGMYGNYAPCNGATAGSVSPNGSCISHIDFSPESGAAFRCQVYGYECAANVSGAAPTTPVITGPTTGNTNVTYSFDFTSTDRDGDQLRYGLSDSTCTATYEWLPGTGYVNSGTSQTESRSWSLARAYTLYVFAEDSAGNRSACAEHTISIADPVPSGGCNVTRTFLNDIDGFADMRGNPICQGVNYIGKAYGGTGTRGNYPPCSLSGTFSSVGNCFGDIELTPPSGPASRCEAYAYHCDAPIASTDLKINNSDGPLTVAKSSALSITWNAADTALTSCTLYGPDTLSGGVSVAQTGSMAVAAGSSGSFVLYCGSAVGEIDTVTVTVAAPPTAAISASNCLIAAGSNSCSTDVTWTSNDTVGQVSVKQNSNQFSTDAVQVAPLARTLAYGVTTFTLSHNGGAQLALREVVASCAGGTSWNGSMCVLDPVDPGLTLTANPAMVQNDLNSTLTWGMSNPYSMNCTVSGPGMVTVSFDPAANGPTGSRQVGPITAKSEYTLTCVTQAATFTKTATIETQGVIEET